MTRSPFTAPFRKVAVLLSLALTLAVPASALAATEGTTPEQVTINTTVSMVIPSLQTYVFESGTGQYATADATITVVSSNAPNGVTITADVAPYTRTVGSVIVPTTVRGSLWNDRGSLGGGTGDTLVPGADVPVGDWLTSATVKTVATSTAPMANRQVGVQHYFLPASFTQAGDYTSSVHYAVTTNP